MLQDGSRDRPHIPCSTTSLHVLLLLKLLWPHNSYIWISVIIFSPIILTLLYIISEKPSTVLGF